MNTYKTKRKCVGIICAVVTFVMMAFFCFVGCAQTYRGAGEFAEEEISVLVGEAVNPSELISSNLQLTFVSQNEEVLAGQQDGSFVALKSGQASLVAKHNENVIDSLKVNVSYQFAPPANIKMTNDGLLFWDESVVWENGEAVRASYTLLLEKDGQSREIDTQSNLYQLTEPGTYTVRIKANQAGGVLGSDYCDEVSFAFAQVQAPTGLAFYPTQTFGSEQGTLEWAGSAASYQLTFDGITQQNLQTNSAELNFLYFSEGSTATASVFAQNANSDSTSQTLQIQKISTPTLRLEDHELVWSAAENATDFIISYSPSAENGQIVTEGESSILENLPAGIYQISYQALAQTNFANGSVKAFGRVAKVENVATSYNFSGETLEVTFSTTSMFNRRIVVTQNGRNYEYELNELVDGAYTLTEEFALDAGENVFTLQTYPTFVGGQIMVGGVSTSNAVKSDEVRLFSAYNVGEIENLVHDIEDGESVLTFDNVDYADQFSVTINGTEVKNISVETGEPVTKIHLGQISSELYGEGPEYEIKVSATRRQAENQIANTTEATKILTRLNAPELANLNQSQNEGQTYSWSPVGGAKYEFALYATGADYDTADIEPQTGVTEQPFISNLAANYYVLVVKSVPIDDDLYLASENSSQDSFYVALPILAPQLKLDYDDQGYVLSIQTSEFGYCYSISLDSVEQGNVFKTSDSEILTFNLSETFEQVDEEFVITVRVSAYEADNQLIHTASTSTLTIERLPAPDKRAVGENDVLTITNGDAGAVMVLSKDGEEISRSDERGEDAHVSLQDYNGDFSISARLEGYQDFDEFSTNGKIMLESATTIFKFYRSVSPTNLNYFAGQISFSHQTSKSAEKKYTVIAKATSDNGSETASFVVDLSSAESSDLSFDLAEELETVLAENLVFASHFAQMTSLSVQLFSNISQEIESVFYLPSRYATLKHNSQATELEIQRLDQVQLSFDDASRSLSWPAVSGDNVQYILYYNHSANEDQIEDTIDSVSGQTTYEFKLSGSGYDFTQAGTYQFWVVAISDNAFDSLPSGTVTVQKISQVTSLNVFEREGNFIASFELSGVDLDRVQEVKVNGYDLESVSTEFELTSTVENPTVDENGEVRIQIFGKSFDDGENKTYYISSDVSTFTIRNLSAADYTAQISKADGYITWKDFVSSNASDWIWTTPESANVRYELRVLGAGGELLASVTGISTNRLSLDNDVLLNLADGTNGTFQIYAYTTDFGISLGGRGYFGRVLIGEGEEIGKLRAVTGLSAQIDSGDVSIDDEQQKPVTLSWEHGSKSGVTYQIYLNGVSAGSTQEKTFELAQSQLRTGKNTVSVVATSAVDIQSSPVEIEVLKFSTPTLLMADDGTLSITPENVDPPASAGYIIELTIGEESAKTYYSTKTKINIQDYIKGRSGNYTIRVIAKSTSAVAVPSDEAAVLSGKILAKPTFEQTAEGLLISTTDEGTVVFYVEYQEENFRVESDFFAFPDEWGSGSYNLLVYAVQNGSITSWKGDSALEPVTINRIDKVSEVTFERSEDYNDYTLSWIEVDGAKGYTIEVVSEGEIIRSAEVLGATSASLSSLSDEPLPAGELTFVFRTLAEYSSDTHSTNSQPFKFAASKLKASVSNIQASNASDFFGYLTFTSAFDGVAAQIEVVDAAGSTLIYDVVDNPAAGEAAVQRIKEFYGDLTIKIRLLATTENSQSSSPTAPILLDSDQTQASLYKAQNISKVIANPDTGYLEITLPTDLKTSSLNPRFFAEYGDSREEFLVSKTSDNTYQVYQVLASNVAELFEIENGTFTFDISVAYEGVLLSNDCEVSFEFTNADGSVSAVKGSDERDDYILITAPDDGGALREVTAIIIRSTEGEYYDVTATRGYWIIDGSGSYFSLTSPTDASSSQACFAVRVEDLLSDFDAGTKNLQVAYVYDNGTSGFSLVGYGEAFSYTKLEAPSSLQIDQGNLAWTTESVGTTAFLLSFEAEGAAAEEIKLQDVLRRYYLGEDIDFDGSYYVSIQNLSTAPQTLASSKTYVMTGEDTGADRQLVSKIGNVKGISVSNGKIQLDMSTQVSELADDINKIKDAGASPSVATAAENLLSKVYTTPFRFTLTSLASLQFNLRFKNSQGQEFTTTAAATNLITGLNTPLTGFAEGDIMYNKSIVQGLKEIVRMLSEGTTVRDQFEKVCAELEKANRWTGLATDELLFDEIGSGASSYGKVSAEQIQAGIYDIYVQQEGSADQATISSAYYEALTDITVESSPMTRTGVVTSDEIYYIEFREIEGKTDYTLVIRHTEDGAQVTEKVLIKKIDDGWQRSKVGGATADYKPLEWRQEGGQTFVKLTLNDANGIGPELNEGDGASATSYTFNIYANGDDQTLNSKTEEIEVRFLAFKYQTLWLNGGVFVWDRFSITVGGSTDIYETLVTYKLANTSAQSVTVRNSSQFSPTETGKYDYIEFMTPGWTESFLIVVSSPTYRIENLTKLSAPELSTKNGKLVMTDTNTTSRSTRTFVLSNDISISAGLSLSTTTESSIYEHIPGLNGMVSGSTEYDYRATEDSANLFSVVIAGDNVSKEDFVPGSSDEHNRFVLSVDSITDGIYLQSEYTKIVAKMIDYNTNTQMDGVNLTESIQVLDGRVVWNQITDTPAAGYQILYEVQVETYYETRGGIWTRDDTCTRNYYTSENQLDSSLFVESAASEQRYAISVRANIFAEDESGEIVSLQGERFAISSNASYQEPTGQMILNGELISNLTADGSTFFEKSAAVSSLSVQNGELGWSYATPEGLSTRFVVEYSVAGQNNWAELDGTITSAGSWHTLTPAPDQFSSSNAYNFRIAAINYATDSFESLTVGGQLKSNITRLGGDSYSQIGVLKDMTSSDFVTDRTETGYTIDFANYFAYYSTISRNINLSVTIHAATGDIDMPVLGTTSSKTISISSDDIGEDGSLSFTVRPLSTSSSYLNAQNEVEFSLSETDWYQADAVSFDQDSQIFSWTYGAVYEYRAVADTETKTVPVYINSGTEFLPYGAEPGDEVEFFEEEAMHGKLPITYEGETRYVDAASATLSYDSDENLGYVTITSDTNLLSWDGSDFAESETILTESSEFELAQNYALIQKQLLDDEGLTTYYLPLSAVSQSGTSFVASGYAAVYEDGSLSRVRGIAAGEILQVSEDSTADNGYYSIENFGASVLVRAEDVSRSIIKGSDVDATDILFRVTIESRDQVRASNGATVTTTTTRIYDNIVIEGENELGIFTATFEPDLIGEILSFSVQVRRGENNLLSEELSYQGSAAFDLFASGAGTQENPFLIETEQQFKNISSRAKKKYYHTSFYQSQTVVTQYANGSYTTSSSAGEVNTSEPYYSFEQNANLVFESVDGYVIDQPFVGNYDGGGFKTEITFVSAGELSDASIDDYTNSTTVEFTKGAALFKEILANGSVTNLNLTANLAYTESFKNSLQTDGKHSSALVAGLATINNGAVTAITLKGLTAQLGTSISGNNARLAYAGIVGINRKSIGNALSSANISITQSSNPSGAQFFMFSPIAIANTGTSAVMTNCRNQGNITTRWRLSSSADNSVIQTAGVALLSNDSALLELCYNTATISATTFVGTNSSNTSATWQTYAAGVVLYQQSGSLRYSANAGAITAGNAGGVAYSLANVRLTGVVALANVNSSFSNLIAASMIGLTTSASAIYTHVTQPSGISATVINESTTITCGATGWQIVVTYTNSSNHYIRYEQL